MRLRAATCALAFTAATSTAHVLRRQDADAGQQTGCKAIQSMAPSGDADEPLTVPPSLAVSCLESVPVDVERDIGLIEL